VQLVSAQRLFRGVQELWKGQSKDPDTADFPVMRGHLDLALGQAWNSEWWPFLMEHQWRRFRSNWLSTGTYNKGDEVYDAATQTYFQCLRNAVTGSAYSPTDSNGAERSAYWAECAAAYSGNDWSSAGVSYAVGDILFYPVDNLFYQCHTVHTSSPTLTPDATGGNERWGALAPFIRSISFTQTGEDAFEDVLDVKDNDPRLGYDYESVPWDVTDATVIVRQNVARAFVQFRRRRPDLTGSLYSASATYAVGGQVYYVPATGEGNFYDCLTATTAGESPDSAAAKWRVVELPHRFQGFLMHATYAGILSAEEKPEDRGRALALAGGYLEHEADRIYRQSGLTPTINMRTYA
jgi:hypothetical protein